MPKRSRAAVLGRPIGHSLSPVLHRAAYQALGLDWSYGAIDCGADELADALTRLSVDHVGVSLTMPLKLAAVALMTTLDQAASQLGAVNTVLFEPKGWSGYNTDVAGVRAALAEVGFDGSSPTVLLGAGGSARAALGALAGRVDEVRVAVRDPLRAAPLVVLGASLGLAVATVRLDRSALAGAALVISTLPPPGNSAAAARFADWPAGASLVDVVYEGWPTPLAQLAARFGGSVVGGLATLVGQAAEAVRLMTGMEPPFAAMRAAGEAALAGQRPTHSTHSLEPQI